MTEKIEQKKEKQPPPTTTRIISEYVHKTLLDGLKMPQKTIMPKQEKKEPDSNGYSSTSFFIPLDLHFFVIVDVVVVIVVPFMSWSGLSGRRYVVSLYQQLLPLSFDSLEMALC